MRERSVLPLPKGFKDGAYDLTTFHQMEGRRVTLDKAITVSILLQPMAVVSEQVQAVRGAWRPMERPKSRSGLSRNPVALNQVDSVMVDLSRSRRPDSKDGEGYFSQQPSMGNTTPPRRRVSANTPTGTAPLQSPVTAKEGRHRGHPALSASW